MVFAALPVLARRAGRLLALGLALLAGAIGPALAADRGHSAVANPARAQVQAFHHHVAALRGLAPPRRAAATPQIIGGSDAPAGAFPAAVALLFPTGSGSNLTDFYCGGTLVSSEHVLTAAHCVDFLNGAPIDVLVGSQNLGSGGQRIRVQAITIHPAWSIDLLTHDVAVLQLAQAVSGIAPALFIAAERGESRLVPEPDGSIGLVVGWGETHATPNSPALLQQAAIEVWPRSLCRGVDASVMCAGGLGLQTGTCFGDSGGPLFASTLVLGRRVMLGVTSFGNGSCDAGQPSFFARMATLGSWVREQIRR